MGEISEMIINGDIDYVTGEYLGEGYGVPRTSYSDAMSYRKVNKYGYIRSTWKKMNIESKEVIKVLYNNGFNSINSRQMILDEYFHSHLGWKSTPKNNKKYKLIYEKLSEFINFIKLKQNDQL